MASRRRLKQIGNASAGGIFSVHAPSFAAARAEQAASSAASVGSSGFPHNPAGVIAKGKR